MDAATTKLAAELLKPQTEANSWRRRAALSKATTLLESTAPYQRHQAGLLLSHCLSQQRQREQQVVHTDINEQRKHHASSFRVGIAGPPGAGKSTFIEAFGKFLLDRPSLQNNPNDASFAAATACSSNSTSDDVDDDNNFLDHLAVLCIDPSSTRTGGSILGDKTRMTEVSRHPRAWVRSAPARGSLGGVARATHDILCLLEAVSSAKEWILVETVGVGQSEVEIEQLVDVVVLLVPPAGGDDLQGVKKGIVEIADLVVVTKADGDLLPAARKTAADYRGALAYHHHCAPRQVVLTSSLTGDGLADVWRQLVQLQQQQQQRIDGHTISAAHQQRRREQHHYWMWKHFLSLVEDHSRTLLESEQRSLSTGLDQGRVAPRVAAERLFRALQQQGNDERTNNERHESQK